MFDVFLNNLYAIAGAFLLACFGGYLAWRNGHKVRLAAAGAELRRAFADELRVFEFEPNIEGHALHAMLAQTLPKHRAAVKEFRLYLSPLQRYRFDRAWKRFHGGSDQHPDYLPYYFGEGHRTLFIRNVAALLAFATDT